MPPRTSAPGSSSTKPTSSSPYSGCVSSLRSSRRPVAPAPTISVRRGPHDVREQERADDAAQRGHQDDRESEEDERLDRRVDEDVEALLQALADHEQRQRAGEQRVEERRHLVEALARDRPRLALVEPVHAEDREPRQRHRRHEQRQQPARRDDRGRPDLLGQQVGAGERDQDRREIGAEEKADTAAREAAPPTRRRTRAAGRPAAQAGAAPRCRRSRPSAQDASRSCWITRSCM